MTKETNFRLLLAVLVRRIESLFGRHRNDDRTKTKHLVEDLLGCSLTCHLAGTQFDLLNLLFGIDAFWQDIITFENIKF